jgi:5-methylcytosine-specific restriction endonuclease McrA
VSRPATPMIESVCAHCGTIFRQKPWRGKVLCSRACFHASGRGGRKPSVVIKVSCVTCGVEFPRRVGDLNVTTGSAHSGNYCSRACYLRPKLTPEEARRRSYAATATWRAENRERVQAYKRAAYRRAETADAETRDYIEVIRHDPCVYCGGVSDTVDHIEPVSAGGQNHWTNLAPACRSCNSGKKDHPLLLALLR